MTDKSESPANGHEKTGGMRLTTTPGRVFGAVPWLILAVKYILMRNFFSLWPLLFWWYLSLAD